MASSVGRQPTKRYFDGAGQEQPTISLPLFGPAATDFAVIAAMPVGTISAAVVVVPEDHALDSVTADSGGVSYAVVVQTADLPVDAASADVGGVSYAIIIPGQPSTDSAKFGAAAYAITAQSQMLVHGITFSATADIGYVPPLSGYVPITFTANADLSAPILPAVRTLGCGLYDVWLTYRGGVAIRQLPDVSDIQFNRILNAVSEAQITLGKGGGHAMDDACCVAISDINPWSHEIAIYRGSGGTTSIRDLVWVGPVRRIEIDADAGQAFITAKDLFSHFDRRFYRGESYPNPGIVAAGGDTVPDLDVDDTDLAYIWEQVVRDALEPDNPNIAVESPNLTGVPATRFVGRGQYRFAGDVLRELANSGIDYTVVNRTIRAGASEILTPAIGMLTDEHFAKAPKIIIDGDDMATRWVVGGAGTGQDGPDEAGDTSLTLFVSDALFISAIDPIDPDFGLIEQYIFQPEIEDHPGEGGISTAAGAGRPSYPYFNGADNTDASYSIYQAARSRWELHHQPYTTVEGGELDPSAPFDFNTLIPGSTLRVNLRSGCRDVTGYYRLHEVKVSVDDKRDKVDVRFENLGTSALVVPTASPSPSQLPLANPTIPVSVPPYGYMWMSWPNNYAAGAFDAGPACRQPNHCTFTIVYPTASGTPSKAIFPAQASAVTAPTYDAAYLLSIEPVLTPYDTGPNSKLQLIDSGALSATTAYQVWKLTFPVCVTGISSKPYLGNIVQNIGVSGTGSIYGEFEILFGGGNLPMYFVGYDDEDIQAYHAMGYRFL
jgi:hypothetical protein